MTKKSYKIKFNCNGAIYRKRYVALFLLKKLVGLMKKRREKAMSSLEVKRVFKTFEGQEIDRYYVLEDISFTAEENEFICIIGKSGCGKSTLLNLIAGFIKPDNGEITVGNNVVEKPSAEKGVVFQEHALFPWCTVYENVAFGLKLNKQKNSHEVTMKYLNMVGLTEYKDKYPNSLSGGMAQRVGIARALANNPKLLLMDEPLGALDAMTREKMRVDLLDIWEKTKKTIVFVTHSVPEAVYLADRVILLKDGTVKSDERIHMDRPRKVRSKEFLDYVQRLENMLTEGNENAFSE